MDKQDRGINRWIGMGVCVCVCVHTCTGKSVSAVTTLFGALVWAEGEGVFSDKFCDGR